MTKQEAIDVLQNTIVRFGRNNGKTVYAEALGMAIEALSNSQMWKGKKMDDCISRQAAIDAVSRGCQEWRGIFADCEENLNELPSAQPERKKGKWIHDGYRVKGGIDWMHCSECGQLEIALAKTNFCPNCGADMRIEETDSDYEKAVEQLEYDILYEPTFNQNDGSM